jgi:hypothetical protein
VLGGAFALLAAAVGVVAAPGAPGGASTPSPTAESIARAAPVVAIGSEQLRVGQAGDLAATGRWRCAPLATPAVLRLDGSVWLWTDLGTAPELIGTASGGHTVERGEDAEGCDTPVVRDRAGNRLTIRP